MIIEQNTNYAYKLKYMENPTFDKVRDLAIRFMRELPKQLQDELYEALNRGVDILDSEPQMVTYLYAFGPMHQAKLNYAFKHLPKEFLEQPEINIIDYGCGQALGTMCYADFLRENGYAQKVKTITLIEPSEMCLKRAALHVSMFFPNAEIKTINKKFDDLINKDIVCDEETPTLHILSNVLDMLTFDIDKFANLVKGYLNGYNQFVCVGPYFNYSDKDNRMNNFLSLMQGRENYFKPFDRFEFDKDKTWTAQILCFSVGEMKEEELSTEVTDDDLENGVEDEYGIIYSKDMKRLLDCNNHELDIYTIKNGTKVICDNAFELCSLHQIIIPNSVISIGSCAFDYCYSLQSIIIPDSVKYIGQLAFAGCQSLQRITIPNAVTTIWFRTFFECKSLQQIYIPDSVRSIDHEAFRGCSSLRQIIIPKSITSIGKGIFTECVNLKVICDSIHFVSHNSMLIDKRNGLLLSTYGNKSEDIAIPNYVKVIGDGTFEQYESLIQIIIPDSVTRIGDSSFINCSSLQQISIPNSVTRIGNFAFYKCNSMQQIIIPNSVTSIGDAAFAECKSLKQIIISDSITRIGNHTFGQCKLLRQIIIPESVTSIGDFAFAECESLQKIIIPESVASIGSRTFYKCSSLQQITLPDSISSIGLSIFEGCESLQRIIIPLNSKDKFKKMLDECNWEKLVEQ